MWCTPYREVDAWDYGLEKKCLSERFTAFWCMMNREPLRKKTASKPRILPAKLTNISALFNRTWLAVNLKFPWRLCQIGRLQNPCIVCIVNSIFLASYIHICPTHVNIYSMILKFCNCDSFVTIDDLCFEYTYTYCKCSLMLYTQMHCHECTCTENCNIHCLQVIEP